MSSIFYRDTEKYINGIAAEFAEPINNIESIRCARRADKFYIELVHEDSCVRYFDVSGMNVSSIGILLCNIISNKPSDREIRDRLMKKEIRKLFK